MDTNSSLNTSGADYNPIPAAANTTTACRGFIAECQQDLLCYTAPQHGAVRIQEYEQEIDGTVEEVTDGNQGENEEEIIEDSISNEAVAEVGADGPSRPVTFRVPVGNNAVVCADDDDDAGDDSFQQ